MPSACDPYYMLCSTPRVGSNLLSGLLNSTGIGASPRESFCQSEIAEQGPQLTGIGTIETPEQMNSYFVAALAKSRRGQWSGVKTHLHQFHWALTQGFDIDRLFPSRFIYQTRSDVVAQAISFERASQTKAWISRKEAQAKPRFDALKIRSTIQDLIKHNQAWEALFAHHDVEPYRISYETLCADFEGQLGRVLTFLGVDPGSIDLASCVEGSMGYFKKQRDGLSAEWRTRYDAFIRERAVGQTEQTVTTQVA